MRLDCCKVMVAVLRGGSASYQPFLLSGSKIRELLNEGWFVMVILQWWVCTPCTWSVLVQIRGFRTTHPTDLLPLQLGV